jgi:hypothetical protein
MYIRKGPKKMVNLHKARALDMVASPGEAMARAVKGTRRAMEKAWSFACKRNNATNDAKT